MRSARGIAGGSPLRLALIIVLLVSTLSVATPGLFSLFTFKSDGTQSAMASSSTAAIEGWVTSADGGEQIAGATVSIEGGPTTSTNASGYFVFETDSLALGAGVVAGQSSPVSLTVTANGYGAWTIKSARYYAGDTLRVYPALKLGDANTQIRVAASPRKTDVMTAQSEIAGALSKGAITSGLQGMGNMPQVDMANMNVGVFASTVGPDAASWTPPASIRVYRTETGVVEVVPFKEYVKHVLPHEWIPTWAPASLRAGAMAVKEYGWYWVYNGGKQVALGADVKDNTEDQVYDPNVSYASTDAAVEATWAYALLRNGTLFQAQYCAGSYGPDPSGDCPWGGTAYMTQWGSAYYADQGQTWDWILQFYYTNAVISPSVGNGSPPPPPVSEPVPTRVVSYAVGQGSNQPEVFVEAYNRNGGAARLGNPTGAVRWWLTYVSEHNVLVQPFAGANGRGGTWLVFDTLKSEVSDVRRAYILEGEIGQVYANHTPPGPEWVGAPTSDTYTSSAQAGNKMSQGFTGGLLSSDGQDVSYTPWPTQFSGWEARYFAGGSPASITGPPLDLPGQPSLVLDQIAPDLDWTPESGSAKSLGLGEGAWSAQFNKVIQLEEGTYDIAINSNSGVRLWIDNLMALNAWDARGSHTQQYNLYLDGAPHTIRLQFTSPGSAARLTFSINKREATAPPPVPPSTTAGGAGGSTTAAGSPKGNADLRVKVKWLGRVDPPSDAWAQPLMLMLSRPQDSTIVGTYAGITDQNGVAIYNGLPEGVYNVHVKGLHSLQTARANIALVNNRTAEVDMKAQIEGDINGDNCVTVDDFSIVQAMVGAHRQTPGWNAAADLNNDGLVTASDVSLLRSGFDKCGDVSADTQLRTMSSEAAPSFEQQMAPWINPGSLSHDLSLGLNMTSAPAVVGGIIEVQVYAETGSQPIDGGSFLLSYDPAKLLPVDRKGNPTAASEPGVALPSVLGNWIDPQSGAIGFAASMLQGTAPQGRVTLATVRFRTVQAGPTELHFGPLSLGQMQLTNGGTNLLARTSSLSLTVNP